MDMMWMEFDFQQTLMTKKAPEARQHFLVSLLFFTSAIPGGFI
jgi:hypothetical protein